MFLLSGTLYIYTLNQEYFLTKLTLSTGNPLDTNPPDGKHGRMVIHVQKADLLVLLAQNENNRIQHFQQLREIEPPQCTCNLKQEIQNSPGYSNTGWCI